MISRLSLESIQIGEAKPSPSGSLDTTAIDKGLVSSATVTAAGLVGDVIVDTKNHGGPDQAVYIYTRDDYEYWEAELNQSLVGGWFGENLTITGVSSADVAVGDRFTIGECVLEAAAARIPCGVFQHRVGETNWVARFRDGRRPGIYCRVIVEGQITQGDAVDHQPGDGAVSILDTQDIYYVRDTPSTELVSALAAPLSERMRDVIERRLNRRD